MWQPWNWIELHYIAIHDILVDITFWLTLLFGWHYFLFDITFWLTWIALYCPEFSLLWVACLVVGVEARYNVTPTWIWSSVLSQQWMSLDIHFRRKSFRLISITIIESRSKIQSGALFITQPILMNNRRLVISVLYFV